MKFRKSLIVVPPVLLLGIAAAIIIGVEDSGPFVSRNLVPVLIAFLLVLWALGPLGRHRRDAMRRRILGAIGFALPAVGLSLYLHLGLALEWDGMVNPTRTPELLFRFLPYYTVGAGCIGFAIGWIIGRNLDAGR